MGKRDKTDATPEAGQKWRARDVVDIHWKLLGFDCPPSVNRVLSCLIGHANPEDGQLNPKQQTVGNETGYSRETVNRSIKWASKEGFLTSERPNPERANHYKVNWRFTDFLHMIAQVCITLGVTSDKVKEAMMWAGYGPCEHVPHTPSADDLVSTDLTTLVTTDVTTPVSTYLTTLVTTDVTTETKIETQREHKREPHTPSSDGGLLVGHSGKRRV